MAMNHRYAIRLSWRNAVLSLIVTAGLWLTPWLVWPSARLQAHRVGRRVPIIRYVRASEGIDGAAWSPVVFPLPTKEGFSKKAEEQGSGPNMESLLKPQVVAAPFLDVVLDRGAGADLGLLTMRDEVVFRPERSEKTAFASMPSNRVEGLQIEWDGTLAARQLEAPALKAIQPGEGNDTWAGITAYVGVDGRGWVQHVFLDTSSGQTNVDGAIVRALYEGRGIPGPGPSEGRVRVYYSRSGRTNGEARDAANQPR